MYHRQLNTGMSRMYFWNPTGVHKHQWENVTNFTTAINQNINYKGLGHNGKTPATDQNINYKLLGNNGKTTAINCYKQLGHNSRMPATNQNINYKQLGHNCKTPVINNYKQLGHNGKMSATNQTNLYKRVLCTHNMVRKRCQWQSYSHFLHCDNFSSGGITICAASGHF